MADSYMEPLLEYLSKDQPEQMRKTRRQLEDAGLIKGIVFRGPPPKGEPSSPDDASPQKRALVLDVTRKALERALEKFADVRPRIEARIKTAQNLRLTSAIVTTVLSSGVVASLSIPETSKWGIVLGLLATLSSIATVIVGRLEGGEARLAQGFAEVASRNSDARNLLDLVRAYQKQPDLPADEDNMSKMALEHCRFIEMAIANWKTS